MYTKMRRKNAMAINSNQMCVWIDFVSLSEMKTNEQSKKEIITMQAEGKKSRNRNIE